MAAEVEEASAGARKKPDADAIVIKTVVGKMHYDKLVITVKAGQKVKDISVDVRGVMILSPWGRRAVRPAVFASCAIPIDAKQVDLHLTSSDRVIRSTCCHRSA